MSHRRFLIKLNRRIRDSACAVCEKTSEVDVGPDLFTCEGGYVCSDCGREAAPELTLVGTVGHLAPIKGQDVFIRAAALIAARRNGVQFVVIGEDKSPQMNYRRSLENLVAELGVCEIVSMPGWSDGIPALLSSLTVFVSAARSEPFGLAIVEAMAAGLPIVAAASEGALEILEDGHSGKVVPVSDHKAMAGAIDDLLDDPHERSRLGRNALLAAGQHYSLARMARDTEHVYGELLDDLQIER